VDEIVKADQPGERFRVADPLRAEIEAVDPAADLGCQHARRPAEPAPEIEYTIGGLYPRGRRQIEDEAPATDVILIGRAGDAVGRQVVLGDLIE
jgi:hypothetical protein